MPRDPLRAVGSFLVMSFLTDSLEATLARAELMMNCSDSFVASDLPEPLSPVRTRVEDAQKENPRLGIGEDVGDSSSDFGAEREAHTHPRKGTAKDDLPLTMIAWLICSARSMR